MLDPIRLMLLGEAGRLANDLASVSNIMKPEVLAHADINDIRRVVNSLEQTAQSFNLMRANAMRNKAVVDNLGDINEV